MDCQAQEAELHDLMANHGMLVMVELVANIDNLDLVSVIWT